MLSRLIDAVLAAPEVDKSRIAIYGGSFGGYWSTILAATERESRQGGGGAVAADRRDLLGRGAGAGDEQQGVSLRLHPRLPVRLRGGRDARRFARGARQGVARGAGHPRPPDGAAAGDRRRPRHAGCRSPTSTCCCTAARRRRKRGSTPPAAIWGARPRAGPTRRSSSASPCRGCCARSK